VDNFVGKLRASGSQATQAGDAQAAGICNVKKFLIHSNDLAHLSAGRHAGNANSGVRSPQS
jgi:hypothetical protein